MSERRSIRPSLLLGLALGGVLLGHTLTYRLLVPDAHTRAIDLARTGHGYLAGANALGVVAAIIALAVLFLGALLRSEVGSTANVATRLLAFQIAAFTAMELLERAASGSGFEKLAPVLLVGLPVQAIVAAVVTAVVRVVSRAAARLARATHALSVPAGATFMAPREPGRSRYAPFGAPSGRAPPSLLPA